MHIWEDPSLIQYQHPSTDQWDIDVEHTIQYVAEDIIPAAALYLETNGSILELFLTPTPQNHSTIQGDTSRLTHRFIF